MGMPTTSGKRSDRTRIVLSWTLLTIANCGFSVTLAGMLWGPEYLIVTGMVVTAAAAILYLYAQFSHTIMAALTPAAHGHAIPTGAGAGPDANFDALLSKAAITAAPRAEELVEFTLVSTPRAASAPEPRREPLAPGEGVWPAVTEKLWKQQKVRLKMDSVEVPPSFVRRRDYIGEMPLVKSILDEGPLAPEPPIEQIPVPEGKSRGQCSACKTYLWAPKRRPIRLRCPKCGKVALLEN